MFGYYFVKFSTNITHSTEGETAFKNGVTRLWLLATYGRIAEAAEGERLTMAFGVFFGLGSYLILAKQTER